MSLVDWQRLQGERDVQYAEQLKVIGLAPGEGITMVCPSCQRSSWLTLPLKRPYWFIDSLSFCCPTTCGHFGELSTFRVTPHPAVPAEYDSVSTCSRCEIRFAANGLILRKPCCGIENPREIMAQRAQYIANFATDNTIRINLELMLGFLVSTFDGLMRSMLAIANQNALYFRAFDQNHPLMAQMNALPQVVSFQNLVGARQRFLPTGWDMERSVDDWQGLVRLFQKRHTVTHRLGVVDQEYIDKTRDMTATLGKCVPLSAAEILLGVKDCEKLVSSFFGLWLS
jgi:hypothetical protein